MSGIVLIADERVTALPVVECGESLCDLREVAAIRLDARKADALGAYAHLRAGVLDRLLSAQTLLPAGLRLLVVEGYRPIELQTRYFEEYCEQLAADNPQWTSETVERQASRYIAPPDYAPHVAGAAVDLTVCTEDGVELAMGTRVNATPEERNEACYTADHSIVGPEREHRRLMCAALTAVGLVNYPTEWWHWSYGDRYWAFVTGQRAARYGPTDLPLC